MREDDDMTLVEFLLARIAEDEEWARWGRLVDDPRDPDSPTKILRWEHGRLRAECEAKRRIVLDAQDRERGAALAPATDAVVAEARLTAANLYDDVMRHLATVYVGHPDYREEWKP